MYSELIEELKMKLLNAFEDINFKADQSVDIKSGKELISEIF